MKKLYIHKSISKYIQRNKWQFIIAVTALFAGTIIGSFAAAYMGGEQSSALGKYLENLISAYNFESVSGEEIFKNSLLGNFKTALFIWISCLWVGFIPFSVFQIGLKGYKLGFTTSLCVRLFGIKGIVFSIFSEFSQIFIIIPFLIFLGVFCMNFATIKGRTGMADKKDMYFKNIIILFLVIIASIVSAFADAFIIPPILKPICSFIGS